MINNKAIMNETMQAVESQFNVQARANLELFGKEASINLNVMNVPDSYIKTIQAWVNTQGFQLPTYINNVITAVYQQRIHAKCAEMGAISVLKRNVSTCKDEQSYMNLDLKQAHELLWQEDMKEMSTNKIVIVPTYKSRQELQLA